MLVLQVESEAAAAAQVQAGLRKQLLEQAAELAATKVDADNKAAQVGRRTSNLWTKEALSELSCLGRDFGPPYTTIVTGDKVHPRHS